MLCIFGFGGFAREVYWLARDCSIDVEAFIDKGAGEEYFGVPIKSESYFDPTKHTAVVAIGSPKIRKKVINKLRKQKSTFKTLIHPSSKVMSAYIGEGSVICANCILTCEIKIGKFSQLNLATTIGHDVVTGDFFTTAPGVHINGKNSIGDNVYFGSGSSTIDGISITHDVVVGAAACVVKSITEPGIYIGTPAKKLQ